MIDQYIRTRSRSFGLSLFFGLNRDRSLSPEAIENNDPSFNQYFAVVVLKRHSCTLLGSSGKKGTKQNEDVCRVYAYFYFIFIL